MSDLADEILPAPDAAPDLVREVRIRFASTDQDCVAIHGFLCIVAAPILMCPINAGKSMEEVCRVVKDSSYGFALMAMIDNLMVGTFGVLMPTWWYGDAQFATDRWFFVVDDQKHKVAAMALKAEAEKIANEAGLPLIINGKMRKRGSVFYTHPQTRYPRRMH